MFGSEHTRYLFNYFVKEERYTRGITHRITEVGDTILVNYAKDDIEVGILFVVVKNRVYNKSGTYIGTFELVNDWYKLKLRTIGKFTAQEYTLSDKKKLSALNRFLMVIIRTGFFQQILELKDLD